MKLGLLKIEIYDREKIRRHIIETQEKSETELRQIKHTIMLNGKMFAKLKEEKDFVSSKENNVRDEIEALNAEFETLNVPSTYADNPRTERNKEKMQIVIEKMRSKYDILTEWTNYTGVLTGKEQNLEKENLKHMEEERAISARWLTTLSIPALETTYTDAEGKFVITHTSDSVILLAQCSRSVVDDKETYTWLLSPRSRTPLFLSNDNQIKPEDITADKI